MPTSDTQKKYVFICGLHRSGTSILHEILKQQRNFSGFENTGVPEDEGQHLQTVFNPAKYYGGPGKFAFNTESNLTEKSNLLTEDNKEKLISEWSNYWDLNCNVLLEKSPPNLVRTRFLQQIFPNSYFIIIKRHPIAVSLATQKWSNTSLNNLFNHWLVAHKRFELDKPYLKNCIEIKYEDLVNSPTTCLAKISDLIKENIVYNGGLKDQNKKYFKAWKLKSVFDFINKKNLTTQFEKEFNTHDYSLINLK
jgi:hypothetical protein